MGLYGAKPTAFVGDRQASDNIEAFSTFKIYELWWDQKLVDDKVSVLVGLHDMNSEFDSLDYAGGLINSSFGIQPEISQVVPSIFPTPSAGVRLKLQPSDQYYISTALYDGVSGDPAHPAGTRIKFDSSDGVFWIAETGLISPESCSHYKLALGGWYHSKDFEDLNGELRDSNGGGYLAGESSLFREENPDQGLGAFFQIGFARATRNQLGSYFGAGLQYVGLVPGRDEDTMSFGIAHARLSEDFRASSENLTAAETAIELNYRLAITPYFAVTPDIQYIIDPSADRTVDDSVVLGVRTEVAM